MTGPSGSAAPDPNGNLLIVLGPSTPALGEGRPHTNLARRIAANIVKLPELVASPSIIPRR
jgi:hypothetical protein